MPKILIIEDEAAIRRVLTKILSEESDTYIVEEAEDGQHAKKMIQEALATDKPFDAVFCDWNMPIMSGIQLLGELRSDDRFRDLPFIMVTAESEKQFVIHALSEGATDYIVKPISAATVRRKIDLLLRRSSGNLE